MGIFFFISGVGTLLGSGLLTLLSEPTNGWMHCPEDYGELNQTNALFLSLKRCWMTNKEKTGKMDIGCKGFHKAHFQFCFNHSLGEFELLLPWQTVFISWKSLSFLSLPF